MPSLIALLAAIPLLPDTARKPEVRFDVGGAVSLGLAVTGLLMAINRGPEWGWGHPLVLAGLAVSPVALAVFAVVERQTADPLFPLEFLARRGFVIPNLVTFLGHMAYMGTFVVAPFMLERSFGITEVSRISAALIARPVGFSLGAWYAGRVESRLGGRTIMIVGALTMSAALAATGAFALAGSLVGVIVLLFVAGVGQGAIRTPAVAGGGQLCGRCRLGCGHRVAADDRPHRSGHWHHHHDHRVGPGVTPRSGSSPSSYWRRSSPRRRPSRPGGRPRWGLLGQRGQVARARNC